MEEAANSDQALERSDLDRLGHLLWESSIRVSQMAESRVPEQHLRSTSVGTLQTIASSPGITISEIARYAVKSQQAVSQIINRLERLGYVERRLRPSRGIGLHITDAGLQALAEGDAREVEFEQELKRLLGSELYERLRLLLAEARPLLAEARTAPEASADTVTS